MALTDYQFQPDYNKAYDNIAEDFYLPCMRSSSKYDRISGYFGSTIYIIAWTALKEFVSNLGKIRLICSPFISDEDRTAISEGYEGKADSVIAASMQKEIDSMFASPYLETPARALACLIASDIVEIKIAVPGEVENPGIRRLFHDKIGIFSDASGNMVGFRGPMNETFKGLSADGNLESIDVFPNWEDKKDRIRCERMQQYFDALWEKNVNGIAIYEFPAALKKILASKAKGYHWEELTEEITVKLTLADRWKPDKKPGSKKPRAHQLEALQNWEQHGRRGILEHATGSGKTFTAMCAIRDALEKKEPVLVLVPSTDLLRQWKKEMSDNINGIDIDYLLCGGGNSMWKQPGLLNMWTQPGNGKKRVVVSTMDTAASEQFLRSIAQGEHLFLVADEVHRLGSPNRRKVFDLWTGPRLGLSATPIRYGDPEGTNAIMEYFGGIVPPVFSLEDAIRSKVLTPYFYQPIKVNLDAAEQAEWNDLTQQISRLIGRWSGSEDGFVKAMNSPQIQMKLLARARIVKEARGKVTAAMSVIQQYYKTGQRWIIYCDNQGQLKQVLNALLDEEYDAYEYYSEMVGDRQETLSYFSANGGILVSIRCLDEGVDIPETTHALILASSKNPREFIQRRGRILRRSEGKNFAYLYDAVVMPCARHEESDKSISIIEAELARAIQFGKMAENPSCITELQLIALDFGIDIMRNAGGFVSDDTE